MKHYNLVIATPGENFHARYIQSLMKSVEELNARGISWKWVNDSSCYINLARDRVINMGNWQDLENNIPFNNQFTYDKILWIDSDISWTTEQLIKIYSHDLDIVCGAYMMLDGFLSVALDGGIHPKPEDILENSLIELESSGLGFMCVKNGVFESMPKPWFESMRYVYNGREVLAIGEDTSWCFKARESGFKIVLDSSVRVIHNKTVQLGW